MKDLSLLFSLSVHSSVLSDFFDFSLYLYTSIPVLSISLYFSLFVSLHDQLDATQGVHSSAS